MHHENCDEQHSNWLHEKDSKSINTPSSLDFTDNKYQMTDVDNTIQNELEKLQAMLNHQSQRAIFILPSVNLNKKDEWKERLIQAKHDKTGERIVLIPCYAGNSLWIGVIIKFSDDEQIEKAEFFDQVKESGFTPKTMQEKFAEIYQGSILRAGNCEKYEDREQSGKLTIKKLLSFIEEGNHIGFEDELMITAEYLNNLHNDFSSMPICAERSVMSILYYVSLKLASKTLLSTNTFIVFKQTNMEIEEEYKILKERLSLEESKDTKIHAMFEDCFVHMQKQNWHGAMTLLRKILRQINPLYITEMMRLIAKVDDAAKLIKNQSIILFLGGTGSGKSTTIHFLAGSKMIGTKMKGLNHIGVDYTSIKNSDLKSITSTPFAQSETKYITPVRVNFKDVDALSRGSIILCDTPGFEDTNGPEVDIANGIGMVRAIKECKDVRPVILMSFKNIGDRYEGLKNLAHTLVGLIPTLEDNISTFSYIFTKYPPHERGTIHASLRNVKEKLNDEEISDVAFTSLFDDMLRKTRRTTLCIDPIKDMPGEVLDDLVKSASISHPEEVFQFFITQKSKAIVKEQINKHQLNIMSAVKRSEYSFIKYKLDQLKQLNDILQLDYIKQVYDNSIRDVRKHLNQDYQAHVQMLNHCFLNQTVLDIEVIKKVVTYIEHIALAEDLRKTHLGKEAVSKSTLIQYIHGQVNTMVIKLEKNDIDDPSVTISLDTLSLLSSFFSDILVQYQEACQIFVKKMNEVFDKFKQLVLSHDFEKSAHEMTKLYNAQISLHNHLDVNDMKDKSTQLQHYFFVHVKHSLEQLDPLFNQEKLEKPDIEQLNDLINMLDSIKSSYSLQVHIPINKINDIYDDFLLKINHYFNDIATKIQVQLEKEDAFQGLEHSLNQMDLIRTIPIIELKTSRSYFSTLEKVCGFIRELKRDVDETLKAFFRGDNRINYSKLTEHLLKLKSIEWFQTYRPEVYTETMIYIEEQIIRHVKDLKHFLMTFYLDLDNYDKLRSISEKILEINEMKPLDTIVNGINEHVEEINLWFENINSMLFDTITDSFSLDKYKQQDYPIYDIDKLEKAFLYLDICKNISIVPKNSVMTTINNLKTFVKDFYIDIETEMKNYFENIQQYPSESKEIIFKKARLLSNRLEEMKELKAKHNNIFSYLSDPMILDKWKKELSDFQNNLSDELKELHHTQQINELRNKLVIVKALTKLDDFLCGEKYADSYSEYQNMFFAQNNDIYQAVIGAIKTENYEQVATEIVLLESAGDVGKHFYKQTKQILNSALQDLIENMLQAAVTLGNEIEITNVRILLQHLKRIETAKQFVSSHLDASILIQIDNMMNEVKLHIEKKMNYFLERINANLNAHNFFEADKKIESITVVHTLLGKYCSTNVSINIEALRENQRKVVLEDSVNKYLNLSITDYIFSPPTDIFMKFDEVKNINPMYEQALKRIQEDIIDKFREELALGTLEMPPNPDNQHIRKFESAINYLPEKMKNALEIELRNCKENIQKQILNIEKDIHYIVDSGNLHSIKNALENFQNLPGMQSYVSKGQELVLQQYKDIIAKIYENIQTNKIQEALNYFKKLYSYEIELGDIIDEIRKQSIFIKDQIKKKFQGAYDCFMNNFFDKDASTKTELLNETKKAFGILIEFIKYRDECENKMALSNMLSEDFNDKLLTMKEKTIKHLRKHQTDYSVALKTVNSIALKHALDNINKWDSLFEYITNNNNLNSNTDNILDEFFVVKRETRSYSQMIQDISEKIEESVESCNNIYLINDETKEFSKHRDEFYRKLDEKLSILDKINIISDHLVNIDIRKLQEECINSIEEKVKEICSNVEDLIKKMSTKFILTKQEYDRFSVYHSNLVSFKKEIKGKYSKTYRDVIDKIEIQISDILQRWTDNVKEKKSLEKTSQVLVHMKHAANNIPSLKSRINEEIDQLLYQYKTLTNDVKVFAKLGTLLDQEKNGVGQSIIIEHKAFQGFALSLFNEKIHKHDINYVLRNIDGDLIDTNLLRKRFDEYDKIYRDLIQTHLKINMRSDELISETKLIIAGIKQSPDKIEWDKNIRSKIPTLVAHICALWTLKNANHFFEADDSLKKENYLFQPHAAQIISIFRILGIGDAKEELKNNLVQIGTGEGKSITLAVTAAVLALLDFDVYTACYSEYLSQRDYNMFLSIFDSLDLLNRIHYGTFKQLCEKMINEHGQIRELVEQMISNNMNNFLRSNQSVQRAKILLIDEVDVFFSKEFYGNLYTPSVTLQDPTITALANYIWENRKLKLTLNGVTATPEYQACCRKFQNWEPLIAEAVKDMLYDVINFESHDYYVSQDKIGYIEQDNIVFDIVYRYKTLFAYYFEQENGRISHKSLEENISMHIKCGSFSYAEIPHNFTHIMGVTGTLRTLSDPEKNVIQNVYKIYKNTYSPSVFGKNDLKFGKNSDILIENSDDYFNVIKREIDTRLAGKAEGQRAALVFFDSEKKLREFHEFLMKESRNPVSILTEEASLEERETIVKRATTSGQITLLTRIFGRGTDFICYDESVNLNGGVHVIQTFVSEELSEEIQIKGRTARQGNVGSYSMILLDSDLEKFNVTKEEIEDVTNSKSIMVKILDAVSLSTTLYDLFDAKRTNVFKTQYEANRKHVEYARESHQTAQRFLSSLYSADTSAVRKFLVNENKGANLVSTSRTICLMDATNSMNHLLNSCKNTVSTMFNRTSEVLKDHNIESDSFQIQFVVYRNYNSREDRILQASPWESKPDNLRTFMYNIQVEGGWGNEAIEIGLSYVNKEFEREPITQVILIGDAPPNTKDEVQSKRSYFGEDYWKNTKFANATYYEDELEKLISNNIPVHGFFVEARAEKSFKMIATKSGGRSEMLDINSPKGSQMLTDLVTEEILRNIGGAMNGDTFVKTYRSKYGRTDSS